LAVIGKAIAVVLLPLAGLLVAAALMAAVIGALNPFDNTGGDTPAPGIPGGPPSPRAIADIPANYLALYQDAARVCPGLHWSILAAIGKVESNHGRSTLPGVHSGQNQASARGPMQFLQPTFDAVIARHPLPGRDDLSPPSPYDPSDAIHAAAYLLCDNGARNGKDIYTAIWNYNHDSNYMTRVLEIAHNYATTPGQPSKPKQKGTPPQAQPAPTGTSRMAGESADGPAGAQAAPKTTSTLITPVRLAASRRPLTATPQHRGSAGEQIRPPAPARLCTAPVSPLGASS
jgi:transglycosylase-like protein with SLT domain